MQLAKDPTTDAKGITTEEFVDVADKIWVDAGAKLYEELCEKEGVAEWSPILSFDRPRIHNEGAVLEKLAVTEDAVLKLCHYAPDIQKVIEHCHAILNRILQQKVLEIGTNQPPQVFHSVLKDAFMSMKQDSLRRDILSLDATLEHIMKPTSQGGTGGGFARRPYN